MKLALVISSLEGGGAERVMVALANAWQEKGHKITLITLSESKTDVYHLSPGIERIGLGLVRSSIHLGQATVNNLLRLWALRKQLRASRADAIVSFQTTTNILVILANVGTGRPTIISERVSQEDQSLRSLWLFLRRLVYRRASIVVVQTRRIAMWMEQRFSVPVLVIPDPVPSGLLENVFANPVAEKKHTILAMGQLDRQKGFDLLIDAFARLAASHPEWSLVILGEGRERAALELQVAHRGLQHRVTMAGFVSDPGGYMQKATIFALSSRYEGMPNALLEAMAMGLPCISFDCRTGPAELIKHYTNGLLIPPEDVSALADGLRELMSNAQLRMQLGEQAKAVREQFSLDTVLARWDAAFAAAVRRCDRSPTQRAAEGLAT